MTALPNGDKAVLDIRKLEDYCLDPTHPRGRHKARVFQHALGLQRSDSVWLRSLLLKAARSDPAYCLATDAWGSRWQLDLDLSIGARHTKIRTIWIIRAGEHIPRFVSCWVM
jgi:hypothetical protein